MQDCFHFLLVGSNTTLRNHIEHPYCEAKKAQKNQNSKAGQTSMARDGSVFMYDPNYLREQFAGLVIQRASASTPSSSTVPSANSKRMRSNAAGARTDVAWEYRIDLGSRKVKCNFCMEECTGGVFRFKHHLARTHQNVSACTMVPEDVKVKIQNILEQSELNSRKRKGVFTIEEVEQPLKRGKLQQNTLNKIFKKDEREKVCQQIARFFYTSAISFNCVKNPEFRKMVQMIGDYGRGLDPPSYHEMRVTFLKKEVDYTKSLLEEYKNEWKKTGCTLMSDGW
ncbi:SCAN domain-containing protein, partial [Tanacetum coccineum]